MATWVVYEVEYMVWPHQRLPKLIIRHVPENMEVTWPMVERAGYVFEIMGSGPAAHVLEKMDANSPADLRRRIRHGEGERLWYSQLIALANAPVHLQAKPNTTTWVVYACTPRRHLPRLVIVNVPEDVELTWEVIERAGFLFEDAEVLEKIDNDTPSDLIGRIRMGDTLTIAYEQLLAAAQPAG